MPLILQGKDFPQTVLSFQGLRYSCSLTSAYPDVFFPPLRFRVSRPKLGRSNLTNQRRFTKNGIHNWEAKVASFRGPNLFIPFPLQLGFTRHRFPLKEEFMTCRKVRRLLLLHEMAKRHYANYKELPRDLSAQSKALWHPQKAEPALEAAQQDLQDIIEFLPDAIMVIDREKKVIYWNRAMEEMTGVDKWNILGKSDCAYAVPFYGEKRPMLIDLVMAEEPEIENRYEFVKKIGKTIYGEA